MFILGISVIKITGFLNIILLAIQFLSGMHYIRMPWRLHRKIGLVLTVTVMLHAALAFKAMM